MKSAAELISNHCICYRKPNAGVFLLHINIFFWC